ncbi:cytochrome P450 [Infundibulicybe gibba]|nr:cytochrome P450 [Infundibulicybe gibba]
MLTLDYLPLLSLGVVVFLLIPRRKRPSLPLPPGPRKLPLIGSLLSLPKKFEWVSYARWGKEYDTDILHIDAAGTSIIVLNSYKAVNDLLNLRSAIYSSRPHAIMVRELMSWDWVLGFLPYGDQWKEGRRVFTKHFNSTKADNHQPQEVMYCRMMLSRLLDTPEDFMEHFRYMIGASILSISYATAGVPGAFLVDSLPILKYVPEYFPGAGFKTKAREWGNWGVKMLNVPFDAAEEAIANGTASPSFVSSCLSDPGERDGIGRRITKETAAAFFVVQNQNSRNCLLGGSDTTVSAINTFILAMTCYPEAQKKAQQEIDRVIGQSRLPEFSDEHSLPYLAALIKEVLRWNPVTPLAIPHLLTQDDVYKGYHIPRDSIVIGNTWAIAHDETEYPDPFSFKPERFLKNGQLNPDVRDPATFAFGYGRRVCPASHIGLSTLWIMAASILSTFDVSKAPDGKGGVIEPSQEYKPSLVCHPLPFKCAISPRSESTRALAKNVKSKNSGQ